MTKHAIVAAAMAVTMGLCGVAVTEVARADGIFNGMNPFNWAFGRDHDDYRDRWYGPRRWYGHKRWGRPYAWAGPYGWNGPWGYPGFGWFPTVVVVPGGSSDRSEKVVAVHLPE